MAPLASAKFNISPVLWHVPDNDQHHIQRRGSPNPCWVFWLSWGGCKIQWFQMSRPVLLMPEKMMVKKLNLPREGARVFPFRGVCDNNRLTALTKRASLELTLVQFHSYLSSSHTAMTNMTSAPVNVK